MVDRHRPQDGPGGRDANATESSTSGAEDTQQHASSSSSDDMARNVKNQAGEAVDRTKQRAKEGAEELKDRGREAARDARHSAEQEVDRRSTEMAERMESVIRALHTAAGELEQEGRSSLAQYTHRAAEQVERLTTYLRDEDAPSMMRDIEGMARDNPGTFIGTSFAAGLAVGRFLRSSEPSRSGDGRDLERRARPGRPDYAMAGTYSASADFPSGAESQDFPSGSRSSVDAPGAGTSSSYDEGRL